MKIWRINFWLDWTLVVSESDKSVSFMDRAIFDFTLVTVAMVTGEAWLLLHSLTYKKYSKLKSKLLCEQNISRLTSVKKMQLSIPKTDSVNVANTHSPTHNYKKIKTNYKWNDH